MTRKVLIADDSQTIQKVIKITLGDKNWELLIANNEAELLSSLDQQQIDLILLDFGLSESKSGYQLCKEVIGKSNHSNVIMLFGTFDTIDERLLNECGATDKIVKPFDSHKFSTLCESVLAVIDDEAVSITSFIGERDKTKEFKIDKKSLENIQVNPIDVEESWVLEGVSGPPVEINLQDFDEVKNAKSERTIDPLRSEISDWGLEVPGVIGNSVVEELAGFEELPPVLEDEILSISKTEKKDIFPNAIDLEYPDVGIVNEQSLEDFIDEESHADLSHIKLDTDFVALPAEVVQENLEAIQDGPTNPSIKYEEVKRSAHLQEKLFNEESSEAFWSVDDDLNSPTELQPKDNEGKVDVKENTIISRPMMDSTQLEPMIRKIVEQVVKEQIKKQVEKISWEIIPDLAERLIAKELKSITDQVLGSEHPN